MRKAMNHNEPRPHRHGVLPLLILFVLLLSGAGRATAEGKQVDETRSASPNGRVSISNLAGSVKVLGWDRNELSVKGTIPDECSLEITGSESRINVEVKWPERSRHHLRGDDQQSNITVSLPKGSEVSVNTVSADIDLSGVLGDLSLESVSGEMKARDSAGTIEFKSVSGDVTILAPSKDVQGEAVSGDVTIDGPSGEVQISSVSGDVEVTGGPFARMEASTVSGDVSFRGEISPEARIEVSSHSGDIECYVPKEVSADFSIETFSGDIDSDLGGQAERASRHAPGKKLDFTTGTGSARIELSSFSGDIEVRTR